MKFVAVFLFLTVAGALIAYGPFWPVVITLPFAWLAFGGWVDRRL